MNLLVLDLDGTLTKSDNLVRFSFFMLVDKKKMRFILIFPLIALLLTKFIDNGKFKTWYSSLILKNMDVHSLNRYASEFVNTPSFQNDLNQEVEAFIKKEKNVEKVILSANFCFIAHAISKSLSIEKCYSINLEQKDGRYTGNILGPIPYGAGKVEVLKEFINNKIYAKTIGLGDNKSDLILLKELDMGYLVKYNFKDNSTSIELVKK